MSRLAQILAGIHAQHTPATWHGKHGFWVQGDCVFLEGRDPDEAITAYRQHLAQGDIGISHNLFCGSLRHVTHYQARKESSMPETNWKHRYEALQQDYEQLLAALSALSSEREHLRRERALHEKLIRVYEGMINDAKAGQYWLPIAPQGDAIPAPYLGSTQKRLRDIETASDTTTSDETVPALSGQDNEDLPF